MPVYGVSLQEWADRLKAGRPGGRRDWSMEVAFHIGMALGALQELQAQGISTTEGNRRLVEEALESAWREILFIRLRNIPPEELMNDVPRIVRLTRTGQFINGTDQTSIPAH